MRGGKWRWGAGLGCGRGGGEVGCMLEGVGKVQLRLMCEKGRGDAWECVGLCIRHVMHGDAWWILVGDDVHEGCGVCSGGGGYNATGDNNNDKNNANNSNNSNNTNE